MTSQEKNELYTQYENQIYKLALQYKDAFLNMKYKGYEFEDVYQLACEGFVRAINTYDECKDTILHTHIYNCIKNNLIKVLQDEQAKKRDDTKYNHCSLQYVVEDNENEGTEFSEITGENDLNYNKVEDNLTINSIINYIQGQLSKDEFNIVKTYFLTGKSYRDVAELLHISHQQVYKKVHKTRGILNELFSQDEIFALVS